MRLYLPARTSASGRTLVRAGRPAKTVPGTGGLAGVCRCGAATGAAFDDIRHPADDVLDPVEDIKVNAKPCFGHAGTLRLPPGWWMRARGPASCFFLRR